MNDVVSTFREGVERASAEKRSLRIRGGGSKDFYGQTPRGEILDTRAYSGIVAYEPTELVVSARCGTPLAELETVLLEKGQMLAFEPPHFSTATERLTNLPSPSGTGTEGEGSGGGAAGPSPLAPLPRGEGNFERAASALPECGPATLGGCIASGLSGPRRASSGAMRDFVLGVKIMDGRGELQSFGGQVMKNVAGYDVSRLMTGSLGTLGLILEVSLKVLPIPPAEATLRFEMPQDKALEAMNRWAGRPLPISATCWHRGASGEELTVRLSGARAAVAKAREVLGGELLGDGPAFWASLRDQEHRFFGGEVPLWRLSVPSPCAPLQLPGEQLIEWGGAQRWFKSGAEASRVREVAAAAGGHATLFRGGTEEVRRAAGVFHPLEPAILELHRRLKAAFDPNGIFNAGRLYAL